MLLILPVADQGKNVFVSATDDSSETQFEDGSLEEKMSNILDNPNLDGAITGVNISDADSGEVLYSHEGDTRLHPASNQKLITAAAALEKLGTDYQFSTEVFTDGKVKGPVLHGDLFLKGKGDPTLLKEDFDQFAADLKNQGIKKIKGDLVGDDTWYDDERLSLDLNWSDEPYYTGAQVSALTLSPNEDYDAGTVIVEVTPSEDGDQADVKLTPETDYINIVNHTEMAPAGEAKSISIQRKHGTNDIVVEGVMPEDGTMSRSWASVWEPTGYAVDVFRKSLEEQGIKFIGNSNIRFEATPDHANMLTSKDSMTLEELLIPFMKLSNNGHGETLVKEMGKVVQDEGSWDAGLDVVRDVLSELTINNDTILLRDGSGMSHKNYIPANDLAQLLYNIQDKDWFPAFKESLPVAGVSERFVGGTLRSRMTSEPVQGNVTAKTGSLTSVSALSGYVTALDGKELIFSVMINNYLGSSSTIKAIEDEIATMLAENEFNE
ncbi:D-alanyl-D-alanine carboxypeptidase/D-alanyl-D-alanine endopeptidase [Oceanobacillus halotolerans]|uniref:D-alanyl-D-alanine carboxypeptidase/D-alanyl-D-alanine endopeptidase n=1 Tax=Oceanobacillus halotolerans TaxID=2663380 RepID=UPI0013DB1607|nr:D-alanyl-D-alanine carboxypeptidase/D-alanyl-D-alanine-endopeptidase [Oceanobacillus halotolerans]